MQLGKGCRKGRGEEGSSALCLSLRISLSPSKVAGRGLGRGLSILLMLLTDLRGSRGWAVGNTYTVVG